MGGDILLRTVPHVERVRTIYAKVIVLREERVKVKESLSFGQFCYALANLTLYAA